MGQLHELDETERAAIEERFDLGNYAADDADIGAFLAGVPMASMPATRPPSSGSNAVSFRNRPTMPHIENVTLCRCREAGARSHAAAASVN